MIKSLVTGGAGFIGTHVTKELLKLGHHVVVLDDLSGGFRENLSPEVTFVQGSITDSEKVRLLFEEHKFDYVYHLAAYAAEGLSHFIKHFNYTNNLIGSVNLINQSIIHKIKCFVFTSSIAVYGKLKPPVTEEMTPVPEDPYGIAKLAVEMELRVSHEMFGLNYVIFRPHNVYGEFQNIGDKYRNVVGIFMNQLMSGKSLSIFGDGTQTRAFSYVGDISPALASCVNDPKNFGHIFNIGAEKEYSVNELAKAVMNAMQMSGQITHLDSRNEVQHVFADHRKVSRFFGNTSHTTLAEGLSRMAQWAKRAGPRNSTAFNDIEIMEKLPSSWTVPS